MSRDPKHLPRRVVILLSVVPLLFFCGPTIIHFCYRALTPDATVQQYRAEYHRLANAELALTGAAKTASQKARYKLFLWFHAQGLEIDEGDEDDPFWNPWKELFAYWRGDDA